MKIQWQGILRTIYATMELFPWDRRRRRKKTHRYFVHTKISNVIFPSLLVSSNKELLGIIFVF